MSTEPGVSPEYRDGPAAAPDMGTWVVLVLMVNPKNWLRGPAGHGGSGQVLPPADEETQGQTLKLVLGRFLHLCWAMGHLQCTWVNSEF